MKEIIIPVCRQQIYPISAEYENKQFVAIFIHVLELERTSLFI